MFDSHRKKAMLGECKPYEKQLSNVPRRTRALVPRYEIDSNTLLLSTFLSVKISPFRPDRLLQVRWLRDPLDTKESARRALAL